MVVDLSKAQYPQSPVSASIASQLDLQGPMRFGVHSGCGFWSRFGFNGEDSGSVERGLGVPTGCVRAVMGRECWFPEG